LEDEHVVEFLKRNGDKLVAPREVFIDLLQNQQDAENFIAKQKRRIIFQIKS
jgi:hypothetical protein